MKKALFVTALLMSSFSMAAAAKSKTLLEYKVGVFFAPPGYAGTYTKQLTADGKISCIDNKGNTAVVASLSKDVVKKVTAQIETISGELEGDDSGPACMDAPSTSINAIKANGEKIQIKAVMNCKEKVNYSASDLISLGSALNTICSVR